MSPLTLALISIRGVALSLSLQGQRQASDALSALANAAESGKAVDEHMALVAEKLKARAATDADWADVTSRIQADLAGLMREG